MKINAPKEKYIFIELSRKDMEKLNLNYEDMDYSDEETRRAIYSVLSQAKASLNQDFELSDTLRVEALPRDDGGCLLFFTIAQKKRRYRVLSKSDITYASDKIDALLDFSASMKKDAKTEIKSSLYYFDGCYYLRLRGRLHSSFILKINEFATPVRKSEMPSLNDCRCIIEERALEILGGASE